MAEKLYRVFVSSTQQDLLHERRLAIETALDCNCLPSAMELFTASDDDQWTYIKKAIDGCDFYIVIVGGRYGSCMPSGTSFTEAEYDYAVQRGLYVMGFVHRNPQPPPGATFKEQVADASERLTAFKAKVNSKMCVLFDDARDLPRLVMKAINVAKESGRGVGYVRADLRGYVEATELLAAKKKIEELEARNRQLERTPPSTATGLKTGNDPVSARLTCKWHSSVVQETVYTESFETTWNKLLSAAAVTIADRGGEAPDAEVRNTIAFAFWFAQPRAKPQYSAFDRPTIEINGYDYDAIRRQMLQLGWIRYEKAFWSLTSLGDDVATSLAVKKSEATT